MLPIVLEPKALRVGVYGAGDGLARRLQLLSNAGVKPASIFADRTPDGEEVGSLHILFVAGLDETLSRAAAELARSQGVLVNVEDRPLLCDFHVPAAVRRGDLLFTVSTAGRSPALARILREELDSRFRPEWGGRLDTLAQLRIDWRSEGASATEVSERTRALMSSKGWL